MFYSLQYRSFTFGEATDSKQNRENAYIIVLLKSDRRGGAGAIFYLWYTNEISNRWRVIPSMALYVTTIDSYNTSHISSFMHRVWM